MKNLATFILKTSFFSSNYKKYFLLFYSLVFLSIANNSYATDLLPTVIYRPADIEWQNKGFNVSFTIANQNILDAQANEWHVTVEIKNENNQVVYSSEVPGVFLAKRPGGDGTKTTVDMQTSTPFVPSATGNFTAEVTVYYLYDINPSNDKLTKAFQVFGMPAAVMEVYPPDNTNNLVLDGGAIKWSNGSTPFSRTDIFLTTSPSTVDFNGTPVFTSMSPTITSFTPGNLQPGVKYNWGIAQTNDAGTTTNGPYSFTTFPQMETTIPPGQGVQFFQADFTFQNAQQQNSTYGMVSVNFDELYAATGKSKGYLNFFSPVLGWFVQNMIYDNTFKLASTYSGLSTFFNLSDLQTPTNPDITNINATVILTDEPILNGITTTSYLNYDVGTREYNGEGRDSPRGTIPAPIKFENIPFVQGGRSDLVWEHNHVSVEQDENQCGPGALANSLQWLENEKGLKVPHAYKPGIRDSSLIGQIDQDTERQPHSTVTDNNMLKGKLKYISDNNLSRKLKIKHKNRVGTSFVPNDTVKSGSAVSIANTDNATSLVDWIISELKHGEDVELAIGWDGGGGHWVDVIGGGYVDGVPWLAWLSDVNQGYNGNTVKMNGGLSPDSGGVQWSYIINQKLASVVGGDTSKGTIDIGFSESRDTTGETNLGIGKVIEPKGTVKVGDKIFPEVEINNAGYQTAKNITVKYEIYDPHGNLAATRTVKVDSLISMSTISVRADSSFTPAEAGTYGIKVGINYDKDTDTTNNYSTIEFGVIPQFEGIAVQPGEGINFFQLDFNFPDAQQQNSSYGLMSANFDALSSATNKTFGFINCYSPTLGWFVQNMIFDTSLDLAATYSGLSTLFNLKDLQTIDSQSIDNFDVKVLLSDSAITEGFVATEAELVNYKVGKRPYNTEKELEPSGTIPAPIKFEDIPFRKGGKEDLVWQHGHVSIEQDNNQCAPASVANSLEWLKLKKGIKVPDEHKPGIRDNTLVGKLDTAMRRPAHINPPTWMDVIKGKVKYIDGTKLTGSLLLKHKNLKGTDYFSNDTVKVNDTKSIPNNDDNLSLIDWILSELKHGEDVELAITWDGGGSHMVDLIGGGYVEGVPWLSWVHDANQGHSADGKTAMNGGISADSGGVGWSYIINNRLASVIMGDTSKATLAAAISESKNSKVTGLNYEEKLPKDFNLYQNYPNPFNPTTVIRYDLPKACFVSIKIFDAAGREVKTLLNKNQQAGRHELLFDATEFASGIYYYKITAGNYYQVKKLLLLK